MRSRRLRVTVVVVALTTAGVGAVAASGPADVCLEVVPGVLSAPEWSSFADSVAEALEPRSALFPDPQVVTDDGLLAVHSGHDGLARGAGGCLREGFDWTARFGRDFLEAGADQMLAEAPTTPGIGSDVTIEWYPEEARLRTTLVFAGPFDIPNGTLLDRRCAHGRCGDGHRGRERRGGPRDQSLRGGGLWSLLRPSAPGRRRRTGGDALAGGCRPGRRERCCVSWPRRCSWPMTRCRCPGTSRATSSAVLPAPGRHLGAALRLAGRLLRVSSSDQPSIEVLVGVDQPSAMATRSISCMKEGGSITDSTRRCHRSP